MSAMVARGEETSGEGSSGHDWDGWGYVFRTGQGPMSITIHPPFDRPMMSSSSHRLPALLRRAALQSTTYRRLSSTVSATKRGQCPKCHSPLPTPLPACPKCSYISRVPSNIRYHEMFDLPFVDNPFKVDDKQLTRRFRKLQQTIHPDAWSAKGKVRVNVGTISERSVPTKHFDTGGNICRCRSVFVGESCIQNPAESSAAGRVHPPGARSRSR